MAEEKEAGGAVERPGKRECAIEGNPRRAPELRRALARCLAGAWIGVASAGAKPVAIRVTFHCLGARRAFLLARPACQGHYVLAIDEAGRVLVVFDLSEARWSGILDRLIELLSEWYNVRADAPIEKVEVEVVEMRFPER
jgi:hypothetical protein